MEQTGHDNERMRQSVREEYERRLHGSGSFCAHKVESRFGYSPQELEAVPEQARGSSFGCANPLVMGQLAPGDSVVDLGSGAGMDVILAAQTVGPEGRVIGVDMTQAMIDRARANLATAGVESIAEIRQGTIESLPIESESVDWVISNCVVNLSPEKDRVFAEVFRVLKPGGKMLLSDLVSEPLPWLVRKAVALKSPASARALDTARYLRTVEDAGLVNVRLHDRLDYDREVLRSLLRDELAVSKPALHACLSLDLPQLLNHTLRAFVPWFSRLAAGKVASIKVYAEKPSRE